MIIFVRVDSHVQYGEEMLGNHVAFRLVGRVHSAILKIQNEMFAAWQVTDMCPFFFK